MPRRKKRADELTDDEVMTRLFPRKAVEKLKEIAHAQDRDSESEKPSDEE